MAEITVIMPVYNAEQFLESAVKSILSQTFANFEFLICDDCSSDDSGRILQVFANQDQRVKLCRNNKNIGVVATLNRLLTLASSPYIARMDADDIALPDRLEKQYRFMQTNPHIDIIGGQLEIINETNDTIGYRRYATDSVTIKKNALCANPLAHPTVFMKKKLFDTLDGYRDIPGCEDYDLWLRAIKNGAKLANHPDVLLRYRISSGQIKQRNMKTSLYSTISLQQKYLFLREFFSLKALFFNLTELVLLIFPNSFLLQLFMKATYRKGI